jgi:osmoprotectant transport system substrate-binding protein
MLLLALVVPMLAACGDETATSVPAATSASGGTTPSGAVIRVGSKNFTEQFIIGEMYALILENAGYKVERKLNLGATDIAQAALEKGEIDVYPEYTGTGLLTVLKLPSQTDQKAVFDAVKNGYKEKFNLVWLDPAPMNNTQALAMTKEGSQKFGITTISEMAAKAGELKIIGPPEFQEREDGLPGLQKAYGNFQIKEYVAVDPGLKYKGLVEGQADVSVAFGTDGEIANYGLVVLKDDKGLFPPYQVAPVVRQQTLDANSNVASLLNALAPKLTDATMQRLNFEVSGNKRKFEDVAREFLVAEGLIK